MGSGRSSEKRVGASSSVAWSRFLSFFLPSAVERRLIGLFPSALCRLSVLPCTLRGGVKGDGLFGRSVGRRAAGT